MGRASPAIVNQCPEAVGTPSILGRHRGRKVLWPNRFSFEGGYDSDVEDHKVGRPGESRAGHDEGAHAIFSPALTFGEGLARCVVVGD